MNHKYESKRRDNIDSIRQKKKNNNSGIPKDTKDNSISMKVIPEFFREVIQKMEKKKEKDGKVAEEFQKITS